MRFWTPIETLRLLSAAKQHSARSWCMLLLAYKHALRASETVGLKLKDIRDGELHITRLKGSLSSIQPILGHPEPLLDELKALQAWMAERGDEPSMFLFTSQRGTGMTRQNWWLEFQEIGKAAGIEKSRCFPHAAKHSIVTHCIKSGMDISYARLLAGHAHLNSTARYIGLSSSDVAEKTTEHLNKIYPTIR